MKTLSLPLLLLALKALPIVVHAQSADKAERVISVTKMQAPTKTDESYSFEEYKAVEKALQPYITSAMSGDGKIMRTAFFDHAHIVGALKGKFYATPADAFGKGVEKGGPSPEVQHHIAWIDISGPAAAVKVEFINWRGNRFTDFFVLYKKDGEWKISGKVYDSHSNN